MVTRSIQTAWDALKIYPQRVLYKNYFGAYAACKGLASCIRVQDLFMGLCKPNVELKAPNIGSYTNNFNMFIGFGAWVYINLDVRHYSLAHLHRKNWDPLYTWQVTD